MDKLTRYVLDSMMLDLAELTVEGMIRRDDAHKIIAILEAALEPKTDDERSEAQE